MRSPEEILRELYRCQRLQAQSDGELTTRLAGGSADSERLIALIHRSTMMSMRWQALRWVLQGEGDEPQQTGEPLQSDAAGHVQASGAARPPD